LSHFILHDYFDISFDYLILIVLVLDYLVLVFDFELFQYLNIFSLHYLIILTFN